MRAAQGQQTVGRPREARVQRGPGDGLTGAGYPTGFVLHETGKRGGSHVVSLWLTRHLQFMSVLSFLGGSGGRGCSEVDTVATRLCPPLPVGQGGPVTSEVKSSKDLPRAPRWWGRLRGHVQQDE